jgi:hypothetical protein
MASSGIIFTQDDLKFLQDTGSIRPTIDLDVAWNNLSKRCKPAKESTSEIKTSTSQPKYVEIPALKKGLKNKKKSADDLDIVIAYAKKGGEEQAK